MRKLLATGLLLALTLALLVSLEQQSVAGDKKGGKKGPQLAHMVFFSLKDKSSKAKRQLVELCNKYLSKHPGTVYYSAGVIVTELDRKVNVQDWDVSLHLVFQNKDYHDQYQTAKRHLQFIKEGKDNWAKVRVFDSYVGK